MTITGKTLIEWGHAPNPGFADLLKKAKDYEQLGMPLADIEDFLKTYFPPPPPPTIPLHDVGTPFYLNLDVPEGDGEDRRSVDSVVANMRELMRLPTVVKGAVMPDACPTGNNGTIPVGGVVATKEAIHPGMHSADICCSMAYTSLGPVNPKVVLDLGMHFSHFGRGGRSKHWGPPVAVLKAFDNNSYLKPLISVAIDHFGTQGDGNHFFYVGRQGNDTVLVTHHGSRGPGGRLYSAGIRTAENFRRRLSPETPKHNAWIPSETDEGRAYWEALQTMRAWTKANHFAIHDIIVAALGIKPVGRFWNEHNFVFRRTDGLFYHAKGATPAYRGFADDDSGLTLIPLNMAEPILITVGRDAGHGLGFAPHGAGRHITRTAHMKTLAGRHPLEVVAEQAPGIDARFYSGYPDLSELPPAYKSAADVRRQIADYGLAEVVNEIQPFGCIMAGQQVWDRNRAMKREK